MRIIDISWPLSPDTTAYKDRKIIACEPTKQFEVDGARESKITLGSHSGTHVDAPAHFLAHGDTIDRIPLEQLCGPCVVLDLTEVNEAITQEHLADYEFDPGDIVLLKTRNSSLPPTAPFNPNFTFLSESGAQHLASCDIHSIGIDYLGIERNQPDHATHTTLLLADIPIIEGLRLGHVQPGDYFLMCLPLHIPGLDGAPARAVLIADDD